MEWSRKSCVTRCLANRIRFDQDIVQTEIVSRLTGQILSKPVGLHAGQPDSSLNSIVCQCRGHNRRAVSTPRYPLELAAKNKPTALMLEFQAVLRQVRRNGSWTVMRTQTGNSQHSSCCQILHDRQWDSEGSCGLGHCGHNRELRRGVFATGVKRSEANGVNRCPHFWQPVSCLGLIVAFACANIVEQARGTVREHFRDIVHRNPRLLAMIPRRISFVPPRMV